MCPKCESKYQGQIVPVIEDDEGIWHCRFCGRPIGYNMFTTKKGLSRQQTFEMVFSIILGFVVLIWLGLIIRS